MDAVEQLIRALMKDGARSRARRVLSDALLILGRRIPNADPEAVLRDAIRNASPLIELKGRRVDGAFYHVPVPVPQARQARLGIAAILARAPATRGGALAPRLASAIAAAYTGDLPRPDVPKRARGARRSAREAYENGAS